MSLTAIGFGGKTHGKVTAAAGTVFTACLQPRAGGFTRVSTLRYSTGNTAHTITMMRPIGRTTAAAAANAATNTLTLTADPNPSGNALAANDYIAVRESDGITRQYTASAWNSTTKVVTINSNFVAAVAVGTKVWGFGVIGDTDPNAGGAHPTVPSGAANTTVTYTDAVGGVVASHEQDSPILLHSGNATGAGSIDVVNYAYTKN